MIIHFKKNRDTGVRGKTPYLYRATPSASMNREVYRKEYSSYSPDSFESPRGAYSLHRTEGVANRYNARYGWGSGLTVERVFVSPKTLEAITKIRGGVFVSLED